MLVRGLRTGANQFFYTEAIKQTKKITKIKPNKFFKNTNLQIPSDCIVPVLRKQSEINNGFTLETSELKGRVPQPNALRITGRHKLP